MGISELEVEVRIRPTHPWAQFDWKAIWRYRDLVFQLVKRDFLAKYSQTVLGPMWFALQPLVTTILFSAVFAGVARISTNGSPAILFYLGGLLPWTYFANTFTGCSQCLAANAGVFGKVYFPRLVIPIAIALSNLFAVVIHFLLFVGAFAILLVWGGDTVVRPSWAICILPIIFAQVAMLAIGAGLWMSALTTKYRDFSHVSGLLLNTWFYATPVLFPLAIVPSGLRWATKLNPMTFVEEVVRWALLGEGVVTSGYAITSIGMTVLIFVSGILAFQYCERSFIDTV